jgi:hypothetical protein
MQILSICYQPQNKSYQAVKKWGRNAIRVDEEERGEGEIVRRGDCMIARLHDSKSIATQFLEAEARLDNCMIPDF